jgi:glutathione S-transferase
MTLVFHAASGSPYAWRVWLALEHRQIGHQLAWQSFDRGDLTATRFAEINPRRRVPVIVDNDGFALYESAAIVEYLDELPAEGPKSFPGDARERALVRRMVREADEYFAVPLERLVAQLLVLPPNQRSSAEIDHAFGALQRELSFWETTLGGDGDYLAGADLSAADFTLFPEVALALRIVRGKPGLSLASAIGPRVAAWRERVEGLDIVKRTWPPHWH